MSEAERVRPAAGEESEPSVDVSRVLRAISHPQRLRLLGLLADGPRSATELATELAQPGPAIHRSLDQLRAAGLIVEAGRAESRKLALNELVLRRIAALQSAPVDNEQPEDERSRVLRHFFDGERLMQFPSQQKKKLIVLEHLVERFSAHRDYPEREVNDLLRPASEDVATLRRALVDYGFMARRDGIYRVVNRSSTVGSAGSNAEA
jgi:hypothetical protein